MAVKIYPDRSSIESVYFANGSGIQSIIEEKSWWQEFKATRDIMSTVEQIAMTL